MNEETVVTVFSVLVLGSVVAAVLIGIYESIRRFYLRPKLEHDLESLEVQVDRMPHQFPLTRADALRFLDEIARCQKRLDLLLLDSDREHWEDRLKEFRQICNSVIRATTPVRV